MGTVPPRIRRAAAAYVGGLPRAFWLIFAGTLINRLGTFVEPFTMLYLTGPRGLSTSAAGLAVTAIGAGGLVSQLIGGWLADRIGRVPTLAIGMLLSAIALAGLGLARGVAAIVIAAAVVGIVGGIYRPAAQALIADVVEPEDQTRAYGLQYWALNAGFSGAALLAGAVVAAGGFGLFFVLDAATCLAFGVIVLVGIREPSHVREASRAAAGGDGGWSVPLHDPLLLYLCGMTLASGAIYFQGYTTLPLAMKDDGLGAGAYGTAIAVNGIAIILIQPFVLRRVQSFDRGLVLACSSLLVGIGFGATALADSLVGYMLTVLVWTVGRDPGHGGHPGAGGLARPGAPARPLHGAVRDGVRRLVRVRPVARHGGLLEPRRHGAVAGMRGARRGAGARVPGARAGGGGAAR